MALEWLKVFSIRCRVKRCSPSPFTEVTGRRSLRRVGVSGSPNCGRAVPRFGETGRNPQHKGGWVVEPNSTRKIWVKMGKKKHHQNKDFWHEFVDFISFIHIPTQNTGIKIKDSIWIFLFRRSQPIQTTKQTQHKPNPTKPNQTQPNNQMEQNKQSKWKVMELHVWAHQM